MGEGGIFIRLSRKYENSLAILRALCYTFIAYEDLVKKSTDSTVVVCKGAFLACGLVSER